jgi:hypothetical protein
MTNDGQSEFSIDSTAVNSVTGDGSTIAPSTAYTTQAMNADQRSAATALASRGTRNWDGSMTYIDRITRVCGCADDYVEHVITRCPNCPNPDLLIYHRRS